MRAAVKDSAGHTMRSFAKSLLVYASYWYLLGPAFGVSLQLYLNHRFGLVNALGPATFPDVICVASCIVLMCYMAASSFFSLRAQRRRLALASSVCGVASMLAMVLPTLVGDVYKRQMHETREAQQGGHVDKGQLGARDEHGFAAALEGRRA